MVLHEWSLSASLWPGSAPRVQSLGLSLRTGSTANSPLRHFLLALMFTCDLIPNIQSCSLFILKLGDLEGEKAMSEQQGVVDAQNLESLGPCVSPPRTDDTMVGLE